MSIADFVEETTTSIAGTNGDGAVTLTQLTSRPRFSSVFGTGTRLVKYVIEDTVSPKFETGLGTVASNVLTRTLVQATWDGTTWDDTQPVAIQFGSTPASGNVRIRMAATSSSFLPAPPVIREGTASARYATASNAYQPSAHLPHKTGGVSLTPATSTEYYSLYYNLSPGRLVGAAIDVMTAVAGSGIKIGLYEVGTNALPGPCITQFNAISCAATGFTADETAGTWTVNAGPLRPGIGWFYIGAMVSSAGIGIRSTNTQNAGVDVMFSLLGQRDGYGVLWQVTKTAENTYTTGLPTGTPTGTYTYPSPTSNFILHFLSVKNN